MASIEATGKRRIETEQAAERRSRRQRFAAPGGRHDRLVSFLAKALPMGVGVVAALMVVTPLSPRGEISFLLDRNKGLLENNLFIVHFGSIKLFLLPLKCVCSNHLSSNLLWPA